MKGTSPRRPAKAEIVDVAPAPVALPYLGQQLTHAEFTLRYFRGSAGDARTNRRAAALEENLVPQVDCSLSMARKNSTCLFQPADVGESEPQSAETSATLSKIAVFSGQEA